MTASLHLGGRPGRGRVKVLAWLAIAGALIGFVGPQRPAWHGASGHPVVDVGSHAQDQRARETRERFEQAVVMLHAKQYEHAVTALQRVLVLSPQMPEALVNLGFAWLGLKDAAQAQQAFEAAIDRRPSQANAYYGLAMALEQRTDLPGALGAMRSYLHLARADEPHRTRARAALWEWESQLGRHPAPAPGPRTPTPTPAR